MIIGNVISDKNWRQMRDLWKDTFGDSDAYLSLVFDNLSKREYCRCCIDENDDVVASLIGIPYAFNYNDTTVDSSELNKRLFKGLYLCGLSTKSEYRKRGIMNEMMTDIERFASADEFAFTFLIPADRHLRDYYSKRGYFTSCGNVIEYFKLNTNESINIEVGDASENIGRRIVMFDSFNEFLNSVLYSDIIAECLLTEASQSDIHILHTAYDWQIILKEKFMCGSKLYIVYDAPSHDTSRRLRFGLIREKDGLLRIVFGDPDFLPYILGKTCVDENEIFKIIYESSQNIDISDSNSFLLISDHEEGYGMVKLLNNSDSIWIESMLPKLKQHISFSFMLD